MARLTRMQQIMNKWIDDKASERQPPSGIHLSLHNPGNKLMLHLGRPVAERLYVVESYGEKYKCCECVFDLPADWYVVNEETADRLIVARQRGTDRCVGVTSHSLVPMSEVLG